MKELSMVRGDTAEWDMQLIDPQTRLPKSISAGAVIRMMAKHQYEDSDAEAVFVLTKATGEIVVTDAANGKFHVATLVESTTDLSNELHNLVWDVQVEDVGKKWTPEKGPFKVFPEVVLA
jgi:hypothetical protein